MKLYWFTEEDGNLCLGTEPNTLASIVISTGIIMDEKIEREASAKERELIDDITCVDPSCVHDIALEYVKKLQD